MKQKMVLMMVVGVCGFSLMLGGCYRKETRRLDYGGGYNFERGETSDSPRVIRDGEKVEGNWGGWQ